MSLKGPQLEAYSASLEDSEERYRALANATSEGIVMHRNGIIIDANEEFARILGYPLDKVLGANLFSLLSADARSTVAAHFSKPSERYYEVTGVRPDGERYYVEVRSHEISFQHRPTRVATVRDITERKKIEEELRRSERELRGILENMQDTFYRTDLDGRIVLASPACFELLQYTPEELLGTFLTDLYVHAEDRKRLLELLENTNGRVRQYRTHLRRKDGTEIWVSTNVQYYLDGEGKRAGVEGTTRDITPMIEAEERLQSALREAEAASRAKGEFLAMMSHEIRTPMNGVLTTAQLLENTNLNTEQRRYVETINSSGRLLYTLLNDVLDLSKLEAGKLQLEGKDFDFNQMLSNLVTLIEPLARNKGLEFRLINGVLGQVWLRGDEVRLQQILLNLLSNAVKFTEMGFVSLSVAIVQHGQECRVDIAVEDSGIGISPTDQQRLFRPFEQGDASITRRFGGTGLGLAITRELADLMGGEIRVDSTQGRGTCFTVALPFDKGTTPVESAAHLPLSKNLSFLLVEDDAVNRAAMGALLEKDGHKVALAKDGFHALEQLAASAFDYLLIDVHMPGIDGIETVQRWKSLDPASAERTRIVALTADTRKETIARCKKAGIASYVPKPLSKRDLYNLLSGDVKEKRGDYTAEGAKPLLDESYISQLAGDIGIESVGRNVELFQRTGMEVKGDLLRSWEKGDLEAVKFWAHRLAGSCRMVGLGQLADSANRVESVARDGGSAERLSEAIGTFQALYEKSVTTLDRWLEKAKRRG